MSTYYAGDESLQAISDWANANFAPIDETDPDTEMSDTSTKAVQNRVINAELNGIKEDLSDLFNGKSSAIVNTTSGSIASFSDGSSNMAMQSVICNIEPVQSGSGDPSPTNQRPITGHTGLNAYRTGKNLLPSVSALQEGLLDSEGNEVANYGGRRSDYIRASATMTYSNSSAGDINRTVFCLYDSNKTFIRRILSPNSTVGSSFVLSFDASDAYYVRLSVAYENISSSNIQLEVGSSATDYEAYTGTSLAVDWQSTAGTVYGGYLDVVSGVLTVDRATLTLDGSQTGYSYISTGRINYDDDSMDYKKLPESSALHEICTSYTRLPQVGTNGEFANLGGYSNGVFDFSNSNIHKTIRIRDDRFTDLETALDILAEETPEFCYYLDVALTYQLTAQEVTSLLGVNNIWCDTGDTEAEYCADTKLYITQVVADAIASI